MRNAVTLVKSVRIIIGNIITNKCLQKNVHINNILILYYNRIDFSKGIDVTKTSES